MSGTATQQPATGNGSFLQRALTVTITLGAGTFGQTSNNVATLSGLRVAASVHKGGFPSMDTAEIRIFGVQPSIANAITTLGISPAMMRPHNTVQLQAGDPVNGMVTVYSGLIQNAWQDFNGMPETMLQIVGYGGLDAAIAPTAPISYPGGADVATIMASIATTQGWAFENNGVQVQLSSPYFPGTALQQAQKCAKAANISAILDTSSFPYILAIWPKTSTRGGQIPLISAQSGLIGYPSYRDQGMDFTCLFNPNIRVGGQIQMQSTVGNSVTYANSSTPSPDTVTSGGPNGLWMVNGPVTHDLSAQIPDGPWFTSVSCTRASGAPSA